MILFVLVLLILLMLLLLLCSRVLKRLAPAISFLIFDWDRCDRSTGWRGFIPDDAGASMDVLKRYRGACSRGSRVVG